MQPSKSTFIGRETLHQRRKKGGVEEDCPFSLPNSTEESELALCFPKSRSEKKGGGNVVFGYRKKGKSEERGSPPY